MATTQTITGTVTTLSGQPGTFVSENPPFHPNILNLRGREFGLISGSTFLPTDTVRSDGNTELYRGLMVTRPSTGGYAQQYRVNFLYNPSTINESRTLDLNNGVLPQYARNPDDPGQYATGMNAFVGFNLLFDRTYELWDSAYLGTDAGTYGVMVDVNAFYNMLNINQNVTTTAAQQISGNFSSGANASTTYNLSVQGAMSAVPVDLYFGYKSPGALKYFGFITQFDVTFTHFTQKMVAQRCAINIGFQVMSDLYTTAVAQQQLATANPTTPKP